MIHHNTNNLIEKNNLENHNLMNISRQRFKDNLIRDLKVIFQAAQIFGVSSYSISNTNLTSSKYALKYHICYSICHMCLIAMRIYTITNINWPRIKTYVIIARMIVLQISATTDSIVYALYARKLQEILHQLELYDMTMKFERNENNSFIKWSWIVTTMNIAICLSIGGVSYNMNSQKPVTLLYFIFTNSRFSFQILKFLALAMSISMRFRHLNHTLMKGLHLFLN